jgi:hypothetical protein
MSQSELDDDIISWRLKRVHARHEAELAALRDESAQLRAENRRLHGEHERRRPRAVRVTVISSPTP